MKKIFAVAMAALVGVLAFAEDDEGLYVGGYIRAGIADNVSDTVFTTSEWMGGGYFGGHSRLRLNIDYSKQAGGVTFRFEENKFNDNFFDSGNIEWLMGYANFCDGQIIAEGGILKDRFTNTDGWEDMAIDGGRGARVVFAPSFVEGLFLTASVSDRFADRYTKKVLLEDDEDEDKYREEPGDIKFNSSLFGFSAKYATDPFYVTGGLSLAGYFYAGFGLTAVENLIVTVETSFDNTDGTKSDPYSGSINGEPVLQFVAWAEYTGIERLLLGAYSYLSLSDGKIAYGEVTPAISFDLNDLLTLSAEMSLYFADGMDTYILITPAVTFNASKNASATVYTQISTDTDQTPHTVGAGVRYNF